MMTLDTTSITISMEPILCKPSKVLILKTILTSKITTTGDQESPEENTVSGLETETTKENTKKD